MIAQLYITEIGHLDRTIAVPRTATIGRDNQNDIAVQSITVSRWHAILFHDTAGPLLADLESTNGTLVNGVFIQPDEPVRLADGDIIRFGLVVARYIALPMAEIPPRSAAARFQDGGRSPTSSEPALSEVMRVLTERQRATMNAEAGLKLIS
jgi:pSer/pThr/pTyr-binding forkhead associated (FHA) protein